MKRYALVLFILLFFIVGCDSSGLGAVVPDRIDYCPICGKIDKGNHVCKGRDGGNDCFISILAKKGN